jgi:LAO/AO transport system kinase
MVMSEHIRVNRYAGAGELAEATIAGDRLALARLLTQVENGTQTGLAALELLFPRTGKAHLVGVTGSPGTGKSTLVNSLAYHYRHPDGSIPSQRVAVVAVDPSSPFTGGAVLGDRVRMRDLSGDAGIFIRSMASRGALGGLAYTTAAVVQVLDAAGYETILIETVGAGQSEVDVARLAHTTLVVEAPGMGDDIQAIKAGILEIADILVINKADRPGVEHTERVLRNMLELAHPSPRLFHHPGCPDPDDSRLTPSAFGQTAPDWTPPIIRTVATMKTGTGQLVGAIQQHYDYLKESGEWQRRERERIQNELDALLQATLVERWRISVSYHHRERALNRLLAREISPHQAVEELLGDNR